MSFDHRSTCCSPAHMPQHHDLESTMHKNMKMHEVSFRTARTDVNDDNDDKRACAEPLDRESSEDEKDGTPKDGASERPNDV